MFVFMTHCDIPTENSPARGKVCVAYSVFSNTESAAQLPSHHCGCCWIGMLIITYWQVCIPLSTDGQVCIPLSTDVCVCVCVCVCVRAPVCARERARAHVRKCISIGTTCSSMACGFMVMGTLVTVMHSECAHNCEGPMRRVLPVLRRPEIKDGAVLAEASA